MGKTTVVVAVVLFLIVLLLSAFSFRARASLEHDPIFIFGDSQFTTENGVVAGNGTVSDPYIIEGWDIDASMFHGIELRSTSAYVVIRDVFIHSGNSHTGSNSCSQHEFGGEPVCHGISLNGADNVMVENSTLTENFHGIKVQNSLNVIVSNMTFNDSEHVDMWVRDSSYVTVANSSLSSGGLYLFLTTDVVVERNLITGFVLSSYSIGNLLIKQNTIRGQDQGYAWLGGVQISGCGSCAPPIFVRNATIEENDIRMVSAAIILADVESLSNLSFAGTVRNNTIEAIDNWFKIANSKDIIVYGNYLRGAAEPLSAFGQISNISWDAGYPLGGNYWAVYEGVDRCRGPNQDVCPSPDGLGDTPFELYGEGVATGKHFDNYPVFIDETPPLSQHTLSGTRGQKGWYVSEVAVNLSAADEESLVVALYYRIDGGDWEDYTGNFTLGDGVHTLEYYATDFYGNSEDRKEVTVRVDTIKPISTASLSGLLGENGWYVSPINITLTVSEIGSGLSSLRHRVDGGPWAEYVGRFSLGDGRHAIEYYAADEAGNTEETNAVTLKVDSTSPEIVITLPLTQSTLVSSSVTVVGLATDSNEVGRVEVRSNNGDWILLAEKSLWSHTFSLSDGIHVIEARVTDVAGNKATTGITIEIQTAVTPPPDEPEGPQEPEGPEEPPLGGAQSTQQIPYVWIGIGAGAALLAVIILLRVRRKA